MLKYVLIVKVIKNIGRGHRDRFQKEKPLQKTSVRANNDNNWISICTVKIYIRRQKE